MKSRVLLVESAKDQVAEERKEIFSASALLSPESCHVAYVHAVEPEDVPVSVNLCLDDLGMLGMMPLSTIAPRLLARLQAGIRDFRPDLVLVYTGYVLRLFQEDYFSVIRRLRADHPGLRFGRFGRGTRPGDLVDPAIFDRDAVTVAIEERFWEALRIGCGVASSGGGEPHIGQTGASFAA